LGAGFQGVLEIHEKEILGVLNIFYEAILRLSEEL
jgi:hypothetical protein